jgi:hypothetical protein
MDLRSRKLKLEKLLRFCVAFLTNKQICGLVVLSKNVRKNEKTCGLCKKFLGQFSRNPIFVFRERTYEALQE